MPKMLAPNLILGDDGQVYYVNPQTGVPQVVPQGVALQLLQQQSSLQQPKSAAEQIFGSVEKGMNKSIKQQAEDELLGSNNPDGSLQDKILESLGLGGPSVPSGMTSQVPALGNVPSFGIEAPAYDLGIGEIGTTVPSAIPEAGASIIPDALPSTLGTTPEFSLGAEAAAPAAEGGMFSLGGIGSAGNAILPAAGALGAFNLAMSQGDAGSGGRRNLRGLGQGAASGAALGSYFGPVGAAIGAGVGGLGGLAGSVFGSSKGDRQMSRDEWRKKLLDSNSGLFDSNYQGTLADNTAFDFGKDKFGFGTKEGDIDLSKPAVGRAAAWGNALAGITGYGGGKGKEAVATQFTAASTANLKDPNNINTVRDNYKHFLSKLGINNKDDAHRYLDESSRQGMDQQTWGMGTSAIDEIFGESASGFDKNGNWVGSQNATPRPVVSNNGSPGRRPKKR